MENPTDEERRCSAYHEAGHVVISYETVKPFLYVTIVPDGKEAGHVKYEKAKLEDYVDDKAEDDEKLRQLEELVKREILICFGGYWAAQSKFPETESENLIGASDDLKKADEWASHICNNNDEIWKLRKSKGDEAKRIISSHWNAVEALAKELLEHETIYSEDAIKIIIQPQEKAKRENGVKSKAPVKAGKW